jgi:Protein of unknown function (DUF2946)
MRQSRRQLIVFFAFALQVIAPLSAYATARPAIGAGDFCSVVGNSGASTARGDALPLQIPADHVLHHCPLCLGGSAGAALPLALPALAVLADAPVWLGSSTGERASSADAVALPFSRAPPRAA